MRRADIDGMGTGESQLIGGQELLQLRQVRFLLTPAFLNAAANIQHRFCYPIQYPQRAPDWCGSGANFIKCMFCLAQEGFADFRRPRPRPKFPERWLLFRSGV